MRAWFVPDKERAPKEQNRNEPEWIEQIGQVRGPIGDIIGDAWETGKDVGIPDLAEQVAVGSELSREANMAYKTIQTIWRKPDHEVTTTTLDKLSKVLGVTPADLIEYVPDGE